MLRELLHYNSRCPLMAYMRAYKALAVVFHYHFHCQWFTNQPKCICKEVFLVWLQLVVRLQHCPQT